MRVEITLTDDNDNEFRVDVECTGDTRTVNSVNITSEAREAVLRLQKVSSQKQVRGTESVSVSDGDLYARTPEQAEAVKNFIDKGE